MTPRDWTSFDWHQPLAGYDAFKTAPREYGFSVARAAWWCRYFETHIRLSRGDGHVGQLIRLMDWQALLIGWLFGWLRRDDLRRRYSRAFVYIPKKNGKSEFTSALAAALFSVSGDGKSDQKVYCAAASKEQASIVFDSAVSMLLASGLTKDQLRGSGDLSRKKVQWIERRATLAAISADASTAEGVEPTVAIVDELHTQSDGALVDVLRKGMISRAEPLLIELTTAAKQGDNPCNEELDIARRVRDGVLDDPKYLPVIFEPGDGDDWKSEETWRKVNPGFGITIKPEFFREEFQRALQSRAAEIQFKRLNLNLQTKEGKQWLDLGDWDACPQDLDPAELDGEKCALGLDLSNSHDLTAMVFYFPEKKAVLPFFIVPKETAADRDDYLIWAKEGRIVVSPDRVIQPEEVRRFLLPLIGGWDEEKKVEVPGKYDCRVIAYDPWGMSTLAAKFAELDGKTVLKWRQGFASMNEPTKAFEGLVLLHDLRHFGNPVLRWQASNAVIVTDAANNVKIAKPEKSSKRKVDGLVAAIMAAGAAMKPECADLFEDGIGVGVI